MGAGIDGSCLITHLVHLIMDERVAMSVDGVALAVAASLRRDFHRVEADHRRIVVGQGSRLAPNDPNPGPYPRESTSIPVTCRLRSGVWKGCPALGSGPQGAQSPGKACLGGAGGAGGAKHTGPSYVNLETEMDLGEVKLGSRMRIAADNTISFDGVSVCDGRL